MESLPKSDLGAEVLWIHIGVSIHAGDPSRIFFRFRRLHDNMEISDFSSKVCYGLDLQFILSRDQIYPWIAFELVAASSA